LSRVVAAPALQADAIRAQWETELIEGSVADALAGTATPVVSSVIDAKLANGEVHQNIGSGMGDVVPNQAFSSASDSEINADLRKKLAMAELTVDSIDILHATEPAPAVVVSTQDPRAAAGAANDIKLSLFGQNPPRYEGFYFEIRGVDGSPVLITSAAFRSGAGRLWFSPSVADVLSLNHGSPAPN
jgi:hypothetical protein